MIAHNKTLAAQLYNEFKGLFPENAVEYFVSYYDYYQPEAYLPTTDTYIEKDSSINEQIDRMRHSATNSLFERNDVIVVASVSCIYGLGSPEAYHGMLLFLEQGQHIERDAILRKLVEIQYERNDYDFQRGTFRVRGDVVEIFPASFESTAVRVELFGDEIDSISEFDPLLGTPLRKFEKIAVYPGSHYVIPESRMKAAIDGIHDELRERIQQFRRLNKLIEAQRIEQRTMFDLEMIQEMGYCHGIENYSRHLSGRSPGEPPPTLLDYFPKDFLLVVDESHATIPQVGGMYNGDRARKTTLVEYGFRLPSALDNRPLNFQEFEERVHQTVYVSATPADFEIEKSGNRIIEQVIRPTGLTDPKIAIRPVKGQVDDLLNEVRKHAEAHERVLVTTLTKRMAEDLTEHYKELNVKVAYLHSDIDTLERVDIIRDLRMGKYDVLIGINLLREGLGYPRGLARRDPRRGQGRVPALDAVAHPDHGPRGPERERRGHSLRREHHRLHAERHSRDEPAPYGAGRVQQEAQHHPAVHQEEHPGNAPDRVRAGLLYRADRGGRRGRVRVHRRYPAAHRDDSRSRCAPRPRSWISRPRLSSATRSGRCGRRRWRWG